MNIHILRQAHLTQIPSGSGIEFGGDFLYLAGDDSNQLYQLDRQWNIQTSLVLFEPDSDEWDGNRILKKRKPDLEAMTWWTHNRQNGLLLIGSGSKEKKRSKGYWVTMAPDGQPQQAEKLDLKPLFSRLREEEAINELNIEAAAALPQGLLLVNRGGIFQPNTLIWVADPFDADTRYHLASILTPPIGGTPSGISGACYLPESDSLLLCLSAEVTDDSINDGEIRGSAFGLIRQVQQRLRTGQWELDDFAVFPTETPQKIESIAVAETAANGSLSVFAVADNDDGSSRLYETKVDFK